MAHLSTVLAELGLEGEVSPLGRWARLPGEQGMVYVAHAAFGEGYYSWCDASPERTAQPYRDATEAIQAALQRARQPRSEQAPASPPPRAAPWAGGSLAEYEQEQERATAAQRLAARTA
jgi:hypothetical protein